MESKFIRIGDTYINVDRILYIRDDAKNEACYVYYGDSTVSIPTIMHRLDREVFLAAIDEQTYRLVIE